MTSSGSKEATADILHRVRSLLERAENSTFAAEAATCAAKAQDLLHEYNIDLASLLTEDIRGETVGVTEERYFFRDRRQNRNRWKQELFHSVAQTHYCQCIWFGDNGVALIGREHNAKVAVVVALWIGEEFFKLLHAEQKRTKNKTQRMANSYLYGILETVRARLLNQFENQRFKDMDNPHAIVLYNDSAVAKKFDELYPNRMFAEKDRVNLVDREAFQRGKQDGHSININMKAVDGQETNSKLRELAGA